jgi:hypothetical protein
MTILSSPKLLMVKGMSPLIWSMAFRRCTNIQVVTHPKSQRNVLTSVIRFIKVAGLLWKDDHPQSGGSDHSLKL